MTNARLISLLAALTVGMFAFGYALGPLYEVLCEITGIGGKTGVISEEQATRSEVSQDRYVTVQFTGTVTAGLHWDFKPTVLSVRVRPGETADTTFVAVNKSRRAVTGQAVPSVAPQVAARHFKKTECFCFTQQTLAAGEEKQMPVRFLVDRNLPKHVNTITLSYSFFNADKFAEDQDSNDKDNNKDASDSVDGLIHEPSSPDTEPDTDRGDRST